MGHGKETPRQKMVGMMYLVLTALLALNVSKSVLDAFVVVENGLHITNKSFKEKNDQIYKEFQAKSLVNPSKVGPWWSKAEELHRRSDELFEKIHEYKVEILEAGGEELALKGDPDAHHEEQGEHGDHDENKIYYDLIAGKDNTDLPAEVMITRGRGADLKQMIDEHVEFLKDQIEDHEEQATLIHNIEKQFDTESHKGHGGEIHTWESNNFTHLPLIGVMTNMSLIQNKIRNIESEMLKYLMSQIDAGSFKVNQLEAVVIPNSSYIIKGGDYRADIFIAARDTTNDPRVLIGDYDSTFNEESGAVEYYMKRIDDSLSVVNGKGKLLKPATTLRIGHYDYEGLIQLKAEDGSIISKPFKQHYQVAEGSVVVAPTKMNVFYLAVENPVDISVAGVPPDRIKPKVTNGSITPNPPYVVKPRRPGNCIVRVFVEEKGELKEAGVKDFRVKPLPTPVAMVAGKKGGFIQKQILAVQTGVIAEMEDFDFDLKYTVTQFTVSTTTKGFVQEESSKSNRFTPAQKAILNELSRGQNVYIQDIKAIGPDGVPKDLATINFKIN